VSNFPRAVAIVVGHEGGYVNHPADPGGETKYGITKRSYPATDIAALTLAGAQEIYRRDYWAPLRCDEMPWAIALSVFDAGVNSGTGTAARWLQTAVKARADGAIGPMTLAAVAKADPHEIAAELIARRLHLMAGLPGWGAFGLGWSRRLAKLAMQAAD